MGREVVQHDVDVHRRVDAGLDFAQKGDEVLRAMLPRTPREDFAGGDIQGGKEVQRPMTDVVGGLTLRLAAIHRQDRLRALEGLDLGLFIDSEHDRVGWGRHLQPDDIPDLVDELRPPTG